jgi:methyl-accepting chemotaxis protein PixJ
MKSLYQSSEKNGMQEKVEKPQIDHSVQQQLKILRQKWNAVSDLMRQATDLDTLFQNTVTQVREEIGSDRALIYSFDSPSSGSVIAESKTTGWTPAIGETIAATMFGFDERKDYLEQQVVGCDDITNTKFTPYQLQLLDKFQIKAILIIPILLKTEKSQLTSSEKSKTDVWGLLVVTNCSQARQWLEEEIILLSQVASELSQSLQQLQLRKSFEQQEQQQKSIAKLIDRIQNSTEIDHIFKTSTHEVRQLLQCDRVAVYRFNPDWSGEFIAESVGSGWVQLVGSDIKTVWEDTYLQENQGGRYRHHETSVVNDIYQPHHSRCYIEILEQFEIKAYIVTPIFTGQKLWGLLAAYHNSGSRHWQDFDVSLLTRISNQFGIVLSQAEYLQQAQVKSEQLTLIAEQEKALTRVINRISQYLDVDAIFEITTQEVRQLLQCDRVAVYRFHPNWSGEFVAEAVGNGWVRLVGPDFRTVWEDTHLQETQGGRYAKGESFAVDDIYKAGHHRCHVDRLEEFQVKAYLIVPVFTGQKLWGLLGAYHNSSTHHWHTWEVSSLTQIGTQFGLALLQAQYLTQVKSQSEELARTSEKQRNLITLTHKLGEILTQKVATTSQFDAILQATVAQVRQLLQVDRCVVYQFNPDWSGEFVAESVGKNWVPFRKQNLDQELLQDSSNCDSVRTLAKSFQVKDSYLQDTKGGHYNQKTIFVVDDIYKSGFSDCYVKLLEEFEAKAYLTVPIFKEDKLWGLLANYQNSEPRHWEEFETIAIAQIAVLLGIALQQAEYFQQLEAQSAQLATASQREKAAKELLEKEAIQLLAAVKPALDGDLTVRAPITEDILGTIADAYNNTLQALRKIVTQVQTASEQVAQTSTSSNASLEDLTNLAQRQSGQITSALSEIQLMEESTQDVVASAELVQAAVHQANKTIESGDAAMDRTVEAIQTIRETVAQTSKKIKRLSESSQKISKVVNLISNFATQTNVLALNAAIEATRAGEYGKGFAVVADEVRSLSRQSAAATVEIEKLVQEIQAETGEVAVAMETGIQQVVEGTNMVNETRQNINAIVTSTAEISKLIQQISHSTQVQMSQSVSLTNSMQDVAKIAEETSTEFDKIAAVFQNLSEMAQNLLASSSKFKI